MTKPTDDTLARGAYHAYGEVTDHKNYSRDAHGRFQVNPMPEFDDLPEQIKSAWRAAALHVGAHTILNHDPTKPQWEFHAHLERVIDGDTLDLAVDLGFAIFHVVRVRLSGVDTPEVYGVKHGTPEHEAGLKASRVTGMWLADAHDMQPEDARSPLVIRTTQKKGKYGRWIAEVIATHDGSSLNVDLIKAGYGSE
jgi:micrococcal nuclease